jgi:hypothetical protein
LAKIDLLASNGLSIGSRVWELALLGGENELGARPEVERYRSFVLQLGVDRGGLLQVRIDPRRRLPEEKATVSPRRAGPDPTPLDENDFVAALGGVSRDGEAGEPSADDDRLPGQLGVESSDAPRLRQNMSAPTAAPTPARIAAKFGRREPAFLPGTAAFAFDFSIRFAIGFPAV